MVVRELATNARLGTILVLEEILERPEGLVRHAATEVDEPRIDADFRACVAGQQEGGVEGRTEEGGGGGIGPGLDAFRVLITGVCGQAGAGL